MRFSVLATAAALAGFTAAQEDREFEFFCMNESGAEFGEDTLPGEYGTEFIWYDESTMQTFIDGGVNLFRLNFKMERLTPNQLTAAVDPGYMANLTSNVEFLTNQGVYAMIQPHNYGRFYENIITDVDGFGAWWATVAEPFADNEYVIFDVNNEFHDMDQNLVVQLNQAAIDAIRGAGATSQYITPEGNSWTGAWTWTSSGNSQTMGALTDPEDKLLYQMHQYLDSDGSGTHEECVSATIMSERLQAATQWLQSNGKRGFLGEFAAGPNDQCKQAINDGLSYLAANSDVWAGHCWWAAGPWWADYMYSIEPPSGTAYVEYFPILQNYQ
ncbi:glycoside hydrolase superfamily [Lineolata rhizophorae]|uniref:cellulase n=1 Tax=Lineolata rhizophorae TaxID=578093 RepID=A0A6A6PCA7_9PEZI|nr:glycoside hydrolase superfamily [Lineolata rhizophorae]